MNNTFNIKRFGLLLKRKWMEFGKIYVITLAVALGVMVVAYLFACWPALKSGRPLSSRNIYILEPFFMIFGGLFITSIASSYFSHLGQKSRTIIDLLIPASTFEKFLAGVFFTAILSTLSFIALFTLVDFIFVLRVEAANQAFEGSDYDIAYFFVRNKISNFLPLYVFPFLFTSIFLLGSVYFNKFHYVKTAFVVMAFAGLWSLIIKNTSDYFFGNRHYIGGARSFFHTTNRDQAELRFFWLTLALTLIFWAITYVRLKEKEV